MCLQSHGRKKKEWWRASVQRERTKGVTGGRGAGQWETSVLHPRSTVTPSRINSGTSTPEHIRVKPGLVQREGFQTDSSAALRPNDSRVRSSKSWKKVTLRPEWPILAVFCLRGERQRCLLMNKTEFARDNCITSEFRSDVLQEGRGEFRKGSR